MGLGNFNGLLSVSEEDVMRTKHKSYKKKFVNVLTRHIYFYSLTEEFRDFTLLHPEYAFLFTHYTKEQTETTGESSHSDHEQPQTAAKA